MRTLTLGVLIVSGGTLAALPFRRYQSSQDASVAPAAVSGPSHSALDVYPSTDPVRTAAVTSPSLDSLPAWNPSQVPARPRQPDIPLTYEDLALPVDQPAAIEQRFNATARVQERTAEPRQLESFVMPSMDSLTMEQTEQLESLPAPTFPSPNESTAGGRLASATPGEPIYQPQPTYQPPPIAPPQPEVRQHHWIRQP